MNIVMSEVKERKFNIDEKWVKENIEIPKDGDFSYQISGMANEIWIVDSNGKQLKNMQQLDNELPHNWEKNDNLKHTYEFKDAYLEVEKYGKIKLDSIDYTYDVLRGEPEPVIIDGTASAKAILKDAISGEIKFFNKDGTIK